MARHFLLLTIGATGLALCACASEYALYYEPVLHGSLVPPQRSPLYKYSVHPDRDGKQLAREGYVLIGTSCFLGGRSPEEIMQAMRQGTKVGAAVVMQRFHYQGEALDYWVFTSYWAYPVAEQGAAASDFSFNWDNFRVHCR